MEGEDVFNWLKTIRLEQYWNLFRDNGYDLPDAVALLTQQDLQTLGIEKEGHRRLLIKSVPLLQKSCEKPAIASLESSKEPQAVRAKPHQLKEITNPATTNDIVNNLIVDAHKEWIPEVFFCERQYEAREKMMESVWAKAQASLENSEWADQISNV